MTRVVRFATLAAAVAAVVAAIRALRRDADPLPAPAASPSEPWPPLRAEDSTAAADTSADPGYVPDAAPAPNPPTDAEPGDDVVLEPEVGGVPVADAGSAPTPATGGDAWREPTADGGCPDGFPIKAKMGSKIFHAPGQLNYDRTAPDRCYADAAAAEADGLRAAKR